MLPHFMNETGGRRRGEGDGVEEARVHAASDTDVPSLTTAAAAAAAAHPRWQSEARQSCDHRATPKSSIRKK